MLGVFRVFLTVFSTPLFSPAFGVFRFGPPPPPHPTAASAFRALPDASGPAFSRAAPPPAAAPGARVGAGGGPRRLRSAGCSRGGQCLRAPRSRLPRTPAGWGLRRGAEVCEGAASCCARAPGAIADRGPPRRAASLAAAARALPCPAPTPRAEGSPRGRARV